MSEWFMLPSYYSDRSFIIPPLHNEFVGGYIGFTTPPPPAQRSCWWVYWFHSVCPSVRPASHVHSVAPTVLVGSISYLYILQGCHVQGKVREIPVNLRIREFCWKSGNFVICCQGKVREFHLWSLSMHIFFTIWQMMFELGHTIELSLSSNIICQTIFVKTLFIFIFCMKYGTRYQQFLWFENALVLNYFQEHYV